MSRAGLSTFYGPAALPQFGEQGGPDPYTWSAFSTFVLSTYAPNEIEFPDYWVTEYLAWDRDDTRPRRRERVGPPQVLADGRNLEPRIPQVSDLVSRWAPSSVDTLGQRSERREGQ